MIRVITKKRLDELEGFNWEESEKNNESIKQLNKIVELQNESIIVKDDQISELCKKLKDVQSELYSLQGKGINMNIIRKCVHKYW